MPPAVSASQVPLKSDAATGVSPDPAVMSQESCCHAGALDVKMLPRSASLEASGQASGPPPEQDIPLNIPKRTKVYIEQVSDGASEVRWQATVRMSAWTSLASHCPGGSNSLQPIPVVVSACSHVGFEASLIGNAQLSVFRTHTSGDCTWQQCSPVAQMDITCSDTSMQSAVAIS